MIKVHGFPGAGPTRVEITSPLGPADVAALPVGASIVQIRRGLAEPDHELLGAWFAGHPEATLRLYDLAGGDLRLLRHYPGLTSLEIDTGALDDVAGLSLLPDTLRRLTLDVQLPAGADLAVLGRFGQLQALRLGGARRLPSSVAGLPVTELALAGVRSLDGLAGLPHVRTLRLHSVSADLSPLRALGELTDLTLALGGSRDLTPLADVVTLRRFSTWLVRGLDDVSPVAALPHLEHLHLQSLRRLTSLPDLSAAAALARIHLEHLRGLHDLAPLRSAPSLRELLLVDMGHLLADEVAVLAAHPTVREVCVGLGSDRANRAARDALQIPGSYGRDSWPPA